MKFFKNKLMKKRKEVFKLLIWYWRQATTTKRNETKKEAEARLNLFIIQVAWGTEKLKMSNVFFFFSLQNLDIDLYKRAKEVAIIKFRLMLRH